jgi:glycosyltransferase involved in cell wall biosynthesis
VKIAIAGIRGVPANYGGFETSAHETAVRMAAKGHEVLAYCRTNENPQETVFHDVRLVKLRAPKVGSLETIVHSLQIAFDVLVHKRDVHVVHLYNAASAFGGLILHLAGVPLVMTLDGVEWRRDKWNWAARRLWFLSTWLATRVADVTVCDSQTVKKYFEERFDAEMDYVPYGAESVPTETTGELAAFGVSPGGYLLFVGRLVPEKGVDTLLEGYRLSGCTMPLVIVGGNTGDGEYVERLKRIAGPSVHFVGFRYGAEYDVLLRNARMYVSASKLEGTSPSLLAAMGARVCCLVNGIAENRETGGDDVLYFDGSVEDLARQIALALDEPGLIERYAKAGFARVRQSYNWDVVTHRYIEIYCRAANLRNKDYLTPHRGQG